MNTFNNILSVIKLTYVSSRTNPKASGCNRKVKANTIQAGLDRCIVRQAHHRRAGSECSPCVLPELSKEDKTGKCKESTGRKEKAKRKSTTRTIIYPSFLFSYNTLLMLQFIDDICAQINPMLWSMIL